MVIIKNDLINVNILIKLIFNEFNNSSLFF